MDTTILTEQKVLLFRRQLQEEERSPATIEKYLREVRQFSRWMAHAPVTKEAVLQWKEHLIRQGYQPSTINGKLTSLDQLFRVLGWKGLGVKHLRLQRKMFRDSVRELSRAEYTRLIRAAQESGQEKTALLMESICATGIRVSEVRYLTVEAALQKIRRGQMDVRFQEDQKVEELQHLSTSFNQMMDHVKQMKIAAYEKELQYRYAQLQYLQLQISPHFFLNILKSLYGMAQGRNYEKIQTAILMISDHVRYIFHDNQDMVPLQTELHHVENYMQMQRYITSQSIAFHMEVEPGLEEAQVPALCLQTFVENSCKYATVPGRGLEISLEVRQLPSEGGGRLDAVIEAARIDGAGELRILIRVVLPMSIPIIATLALLVGLAYWNDWLNGLYYISDDRLFSIQVLLNRMLLDVQFLMSNSDAAKSLQQNEEFVLPSTGIRMAVAVMGALPILVVYPFFQKYFVKGIVIGAVKG